MERVPDDTCESSFAAIGRSLGQREESVRTRLVMRILPDTNFAG